MYRKIKTDEIIAEYITHQAIPKPDDDFKISE
jgi:hypothetical protein